ncbi:MAG: hypothetical protein HY403_10765 [Elusimicrobia bacterium]|nr:hypothetical protein [Elusimicrobiota bacterium]
MLRLTFLCLLMLAGPARSVPAKEESMGDFARHVQVICEKAPAPCSKLRALQKAHEALLGEAKACGPRCPAPDMDRLLRRAFDQLLDCERVVKLPSCEALGYWMMDPGYASGLPDVGGWIASESGRLEKVLDPLEAEAARLERSRDSPGKTDEIVALAVRGGQAYDDFAALSLLIDRAGEPGWDATKARRAKANVLAERLASLRDRLIALESSHRLASVSRFDASLAPMEPGGPGLRVPRRSEEKMARLLNDPFARRTAEEGVGLRPPESPLSGAPARREGTYMLSAPRPLPARPTVREVPPPGASEFEEKILASLTADANWVEIAKAGGMTRTVGDPIGRAGLVHRQGKATCAVVSQQGVLMEYGVLPESSADRKKIEAELAGKARRGGYFYDEGTYLKHSGNLLIASGLLVTKSAHAEPADLDAAVMRGGIVIVDVNGDALYGGKGFVGHTVIVTGAERARWGGRVLGYYINDSDPPSGSSGSKILIPRARFLKAWRGIKERQIMEAR